VATIVLVHGGFQGGWCWGKVTPHLRAAGHRVVTPTLTGLGERAHLLSPAVNLSTHIQDIVSVLFYEDLHDVILVGHSYAGIVIAGVAEAAPERLSRLVYLDASVPEDGQTYFDALDDAFRERWTANAVEIQGTRVYPPPAQGWLPFLTGCDITDPADIRWMGPRLTPHPLATMEEAIRLRSPRAAQLPVDYVWCSRGVVAEDVERAMQKADLLGWGLHELDSNHEAMITAPQALATMLNEIAG
jgi:pimeloyl-ACP methyl ester carboxylesterase